MQRNATNTQVRPEILWPGSSKRNYRYWIFPLNQVFNPSQPCNYIFARKNQAGLWEPVYIGEASDIQERFDTHEKWPSINLHGATHVMAHTTLGGKAVRLAEETDLRQNWWTPCNDQ